MDRSRDQVDAGLTPRPTKWTRHLRDGVASGWPARIRRKPDDVASGIRVRDWVLDDLYRRSYRPMLLTKVHPRRNAWAATSRATFRRARRVQSRAIRAAPDWCQRGHEVGRPETSASRPVGVVPPCVESPPCGRRSDCGNGVETRIRLFDARQLQGPVQARVREKALTNGWRPRADPSQGVGAPGGIRTPDQWLRKPLLYPAELQARRCDRARTGRAGGAF